MAGINEDVKEIMDAIPVQHKSDVFRALWFEYVKEDFLSYMETMEEAENLSEEEKEEIADAGAERYVYNVSYNLEISYWENIESLVNDELEKELSQKGERT